MNCWVSQRCIEATTPQTACNTYIESVFYRWARRHVQSLQKSDFHSGFEGTTKIAFMCLCVVCAGSSWWCRVCIATDWILFIWGGIVVRLNAFWGCAQERWDCLERARMLWCCATEIRSRILGWCVLQPSADRRPRRRLLIEWSAIVCASAHHKHKKCFITLNRWDVGHLLYI